MLLRTRSCFLELDSTADRGRSNTLSQIFVLYLLQAIVAPLQGFVNALIYGLDRDIRTRYHQLCCTIIGRPPPVSNSVTSTTMESSGSLPQSDYTYVQNCVALVSCLGPCDRDLRS